MPDRCLLAKKSHTAGSAVASQPEASKAHPTNERAGEWPRMIARATRGVEITERGGGGGLSRKVCLLLRIGNARAMPKCNTVRVMINV